MLSEKTKRQHRIKVRWWLDLRLGLGLSCLAFRPKPCKTLRFIRMLKMSLKDSRSKKTAPWTLLFSLRITTKKEKIHVKKKWTNSTYACKRMTKIWTNANPKSPVLKPVDKITNTERIWVWKVLWSFRWISLNISH